VAVRLHGIQQWVVAVVVMWVQSVLLGESLVRKLLGPLERVPVLVELLFESPESVLNLIA
jgi:hypothetical protein